MIIRFMWKNYYKDYQPDKEWVHEKVEPGEGIVGCEMHEINGWQELQHVAKKKEPGWLHQLLNALFEKR